MEHRFIKMLTKIVLLSIILSLGVVQGQDSVDVTFYYEKYSGINRQLQFFFLRLKIVVPVISLFIFQITKDC